MRDPVDAGRVRSFLAALGREADVEVRAYLTGGATAVMLGWRASTADVDLVFVPDRDRLLRAIPRLKDELSINVELASPAHFMPELPGWESRSLFAAREGLVDPARARSLYAEIEPLLYRFPAIDPIALRERVDAVFTTGGTPP